MVYNIRPYRTYRLFYLFSQILPQAFLATGLPNQPNPYLKGHLTFLKHCRNTAAQKKNF